MFSWYYIEGILIQSCYTLLIVLGLSILTGYTGMFSFGHAARSRSTSRATTSASPRSAWAKRYD